MFCFKNFILEPGLDLTKKFHCRLWSKIELHHRVKKSCISRSKHPTVQLILITLDPSYGIMFNSIKNNKDLASNQIKSWAARYYKTTNKEFSKPGEHQSRLVYHDHHWKIIKLAIILDIVKFFCQKINKKVKLHFWNKSATQLNFQIKIIKTKRFAADFGKHCFAAKLFCKLQFKMFWFFYD